MKGLMEVKKLTVIDIIDNETDPLSSPCCCMKPTPSVSSKELDDRPCVFTQELMTVIKEQKALDFNIMCHAAHGLSLLLIAEYDVVNNDGNTETKESHLLFDGGPDPVLWINNASKLNVDLSCIDNVVLSHYHVDHSHGLRGAVKEICKARIKKACLEPMIVDLHKSSIISRGIKVRGKVHPMKPNNPTSEEFESLGASVAFHDKEHIIDGCFYVSGHIPRLTSFELGIPGHFTALPDGNWIPDEEILDERYVAVKIRGRGIVVFSACSHSGIINVCNDVVKNLNSNLTGVVGGFHLAGRSVEDKIDETIGCLRRLNPDILLAGHCTGWKAKVKLSQSFEYNFQPLSVGGRYIFNAM